MKPIITKLKNNLVQINTENIPDEEHRGLLLLKISEFLDSIKIENTCINDSMFIDYYNYLKYKKDIENCFFYYKFEMPKKILDYNDLIKYSFQIIEEKNYKIVLNN